MIPLIKPLVRVDLLRSLIVSAQRVQTKVSVSPKLLALQKKFQEKSDLPVFLRGGPTDKILYYTTLGLCIYCPLELVYYVYQNCM